MCLVQRLISAHHHGGARKSDAGSSGHRCWSGARRRGHHPVDRGHNWCRGAATPPGVRWLPIRNVSYTHNRCGGWPEASVENGTQTVHQYAPMVQPDRRQADQRGHGTWWFLSLSPNSKIKRRLQNFGNIYFLLENHRFLSTGDSLHERIIFYYVYFYNICPLIIYILHVLYENCQFSIITVIFISTYIHPDKMFSFVSPLGALCFSHSTLFY